MHPVGRALFDALRAAMYERAAVGPVGDPAAGGGWLELTDPGNELDEASLRRRLDWWWRTPSH